MAIEIIEFLSEAGLLKIILPFLIIFVLVYGVLSRTKIFKDDKLNALISLVIGLISLRVNFYAGCFSELFLFLIIALIVTLVIFILIGLFSDLEKKWLRYSMLIVSVVVSAMIVISSDECGLGPVFLWLQNNLAWILGVVAVGVVIWFVMKGSGGKKNGKEELLTPQKRKPSKKPSGGPSGDAGLDIRRRP